MIEVDGHQIDYPDTRLSRRFRRWIITPLGRAFEIEFVNMARDLARNGDKASGYAIGQWTRARGRGKLPFHNSYGPILGRVAVAKFPELAKTITFKPVGWGKGADSEPPDGELF